MPALLVVAVIVGALALGANALMARAGEAAASGNQKDEVALVAAGGSGATDSDSERTDPVSHVTFGAHTTATEACESCHPDAPTDEIVCRSCHANVCGKDSKTVSDCLECHQTGTTDSWVID